MALPMEEEKTSEKTPASRSLAMTTIKENLSNIVLKVHPEDICDDLLSNDIISLKEYDDCLESVGSPKSRTRKLVSKLLQAVEVDFSAFDVFCNALEKSGSQAAQECGKKLKGIMTQQ